MGIVVWVLAVLFGSVMFVDEKLYMIILHSIVYVKRIQEEGRISFHNPYIFRQEVSALRKIYTDRFLGPGMPLSC